MKLHRVTLGALLLLLLASCGRTLKTSAIDLRTFIGCAVREFTFLAKKPGCRGLRVTTDACWGRCETWEVRLCLGPRVAGWHRHPRVVLPPPRKALDRNPPNIKQLAAVYKTGKCCVLLHDLLVTTVGGRALC